jgi:putative phage-type endonuclease
MDEKRRAFLEGRQKGIGGSDVAPILGLSPWASPIDVWESKVNPIKEDDGEIADCLHFGNVLEDVVAQEFVRRTGMKVQRRNNVIHHKKYPELIANPDRVVVGERAGLECKTANAFMKESWGESGTDDVPIPYILQCMHYMEVTERKTWWLAVLIGGNDFRWYAIPWNPKLAKVAQEKCRAFWNDNVIPKVQPDPINLEDVKKLYALGKEASPITADEAIINAHSALKAIKSQVKEGTAKQKELELQIKLFMGDHDLLVHPETGDKMVTWKGQEANTFQGKLFKAAYPDLHAEHCILVPKRQFLTK